MNNLQFYLTRAVTRIWHQFRFVSLPHATFGGHTRPSKYAYSADGHGEWTLVIKARKAGLTLRGAGCFTSAGRVTSTSADGTLFSYVNTLSRPRRDNSNRKCVRTLWPEPVCLRSAETVRERKMAAWRAWLLPIRACLSLARQTNSFCLNVAWAINIFYLVFISKSSSMKILQYYKHHVYGYSFSVVRHFVENVTWPGPKRVSKCQIFI